MRKLTTFHVPHRGCRTVTRSMTGSLHRPHILNRSHLCILPLSTSHGPWAPQRKPVCSGDHVERIPPPCPIRCSHRCHRLRRYRSSTDDNDDGFDFDFDFDFDRFGRCRHGCAFRRNHHDDAGKQHLGEATGCHVRERAQSRRIRVLTAEGRAGGCGQERLRKAKTHDHNSHPAGHDGDDEAGPVGSDRGCVHHFDAR